jgi:hypothetical protein
MVRCSLRRLLSALALVTLAGCASTSAPVLYSEASRKAPPAQKMQADIDDCRAQAQAAVGVNGIKAQKVANATAKRGVEDFVDEGVEQIVASSRSAWNKARGAAAGVMAGSLTAVLLNWNEPDSVYRNHVDLCLKERGHKVLGWR